jgi:hypothetical protein
MFQITGSFETYADNCFISRIQKFYGSFNFCIIVEISFSLFKTEHA